VRSLNLDFLDCQGETGIGISGCRCEGRDGAPRVTAALREDGWRVSENTVAALMRQMGLAARRKKKRRGSTRPGRGRRRAPDLVKRKFAADGTSQRWYGDGTEVKTGEGKLYLDSVLDMGSRRILGFALGAHHDAALAYGALAMGVAVRGGTVPGIVLRTDQGSEYTARAFRAACERLGIAQPTGRPGSAPGNAVTGSWHSTLESGLRSLHQFATRAQARAAVAAWAGDCNTARRHSALGIRRRLRRRPFPVRCAPPPNRQNRCSSKQKRSQNYAKPL